MTESAKSERAFDIFETLDAINRFNVKYYQNLPDHRKKAFVPFVVFQWMLGNSYGDHTLMLNIANEYVFKLYRHPALLYKLLVACSQCADNPRYTWVPFAKSKPSLNALVDLVARGLQCSKREAAIYLPSLQDSDLEMMAYELGYQPDEMKPINAEIAKRSKA